MTSAIDPANPIEGTPTTLSVRANFAAAKAEIDALQLRTPSFPEPIGAVGHQVKPSEYAGLFVCAQTPFCAALATTSQTAEVRRVIPLVMPRSGTITQVGLEVTTGVASSLYLGLYRPAAGDIYQPGERLAYANAISTAAPAWKMLDCDVEVISGDVLFLYYIVTAAAVTMRTIAAASTLAFWPPGIAATAMGRNIATVTGATYPAPADLTGALAGPLQSAVPLVRIIM